MGTEADPQTAPPQTARLDVWLWRARFFRTRTLASEHVEGPGVRLSRQGQTRRVGKAAIGVRVGDVLSFGRGTHILHVEVVALGLRRGGAPEARALYRPLDGTENKHAEDLQGPAGRRPPPDPGADDHA